MNDPYSCGYLAARSGFSWILNPYHPWFYPAQRAVWCAGYDDALEDRTPMPARRLQAEFEAR